MKYSKIKRIQRLHDRVIHGDQSYTDAEMYEEAKAIKHLNNATLTLVCERCFPMLNQPNYPHFSAEHYDIRYPKIYKVVDAREWNQATE